MDTLKIRVFNSQYTPKKPLDLTDFVDMANARYRSIAHVLKNILRQRDANMGTPTTDGWLIVRILDVHDTGYSRTLTVDMPQHKLSYTFKCKVDVSMYVRGLIVAILIERKQVADVLLPDIPVRMPFRVAGAPRYLALVSDIHIGSLHFAAPEFDILLNYLNTRTDIDLLFFAGDVIDGCGVFQEQLLKQNLQTFNEQIHKLTRLLKRLRSDLTILIGPGNHDNMMGRLEPQAPLKPYRLPFPKNVITLTNPAMVEMPNGLRILYDHGTGLNSCIDSIEQLNYNNIFEVMKYSLRNRHLAPVTSVAVPGANDPKVITKIPDLLVSGHVHKWCAGLYHGTLLINCGTFENPASYMTTMGIDPDVCIVTLVNMNDITDVKRLTIIDKDVLEETFSCQETIEQ